MSVYYKTYRCHHCKRWKESEGVGNRRRCPRTGEMRWAGDNAENCHFVVIYESREGRYMAC